MAARRPFLQYRSQQCSQPAIVARVVNKFFDKNAYRSLRLELLIACAACFGKGEEALIACRGKQCVARWEAPIECADTDVGTLRDFVERGVGAAFDEQRLRSFENARTVASGVGAQWRIVGR